VYCALALKDIRAVAKRTAEILNEGIANNWMRRAIFVGKWVSLNELIPDRSQ
jgi:hypothetical protein